MEDRLTPSAGALDPTFGVGGKVTTDFAGIFDVAMALQADGKIVVVGDSVIGGFGDFALARYNADGSLDDSFGPGGKVTTDIGGADRAGAVAIQADGKIVVAGTTTGGGSEDFALARYNADGSLDDSFGTSGEVTTNFTGDNDRAGNDRAFAMAIQADGKIVVAGTTLGLLVADFALARYNADGSLDDSFGTSGKVTTDFGGDFFPEDMVFAMALQADGKIVVAGETNGGDGADFALARYNADGSLDDGFGTSGKVTTDFGGDEDRAFGVAIQADGRIVVVGHSVVGDAVDFALGRYNADGRLDDGGPNDSTPADTFGTSGKVTTDFGSTIDRATSVVLPANGKIVVAGSTFGGGSEDFALARYNADGTLDDGFGTSGKVTTDFGGSDRATSVALQTDGKIVVAGSTFGGGFGGLALARYLGDPTPQEQIEDLGEDVDDLVTGGALTSGQGNALKAKLEAALDMIARGQINAAVNQLGAFIHQVESYVAAGILSDDEADNLLDAATALLASLTT